MESSTGSRTTTKCSNPTTDPQNLGPQSYQQTQGRQDIIGGGGHHLKRVCLILSLHPFGSILPSFTLSFPPPRPRSTSIAEGVCKTLVLFVLSTAGAFHRLQKDIIITYCIDIQILTTILGHK